MSSRTQIVCLHEGKRGHSIDPIFIHSLIKALNPAWIRPWKGSNIVRTRDCGGRTTLIDTMPGELKSCVSMGGDTTLMVWADLDHDMADGEKLKAEFWKAARKLESLGHNLIRLFSCSRRIASRTGWNFCLRVRQTSRRKAQDKIMAESCLMRQRRWRTNVGLAPRFRTPLLRWCGHAKTGNPLWRR